MLQKIARFIVWGMAVLVVMLTGQFERSVRAQPISTAAGPSPTSPNSGISLDGSGAPDLQVTAANEHAIDLAARLDGLRVSSRQIGRVTYTHLSGNGFGVGAHVGAPDLPVLRRYVEIPFGAKPTLEMGRSQLVETSLSQLGLPHPLAPLQPPACKCTDPSAAAFAAPDAAIYAQDAYFPASPIAITDDFIERGHRILVVEVWPVAYNPVDGGLRFYSQVDFRINLADADMALTHANAARYATPEFDSRLSRQVLNYNQGRGASLFSPTTPIGYLIITADAYYDAMSPFVTLQQARGFQVTITKLSQIPATTKEQIKAYIQTAYTTWPIPPSYVLLVGDTDTIPAWNSTQASGKYTDLYYFTMDGASDWHPDLGRGRFPVRSAAQATIMVNKYLTYHGFTGNEPWLKKIAYIATCDQYTVAEGTHNYVINTYTQPKGYTGIFPANPQPGGDKIYCITHSGNAQNIRNAANDGRWAIIYSGHGSETGWADGSVSFSQTDVRNLSDYGFFPFVASHACVTGSFNQPEAYAETWVLQDGKGALVFWGASHNTYWGEDDVLERAMFDSLFAEGPVRADVWTMTDYGLAHVEAFYPSSARYYYEAYNIMGEGSVKILLEPEGPDLTLTADPAEVNLCQADSVTTTLTAETLRSAGQTIALQAQNVPAGVSATFSPPSFVLPGNSQLTLSGDGSTSFGVYPLAVLGQTTEISATTLLTLNVFTTEPSLPVLHSPAADANNQPLRPTFAWEAVQAGRFDLQVATDPAFTQLVINRTDLTDDHFTPDADLLPNTIYYWRVRAHNACGESAFSPAARFLTEPSAGQCAMGTSSVTLLSAAFEGQAPGWSHTGSADTWNFSNVRYHGGVFSFLAQDVSFVSDQQLLSPVIDLPSGQAPLTFAFWDYQRLENRSGGCYDGGILEISTDGGQTWLQLEDQLLTNPYDGPVAAGSQNPLAGLNAWCGKPRSWSQTLVDLDEFAGRSVQLRFRLGTNNAIAYEGWYVDDVTLTACAPTVLFGASLPQQALPGESVWHTFLITNTGATTDTFDLSLSGFAWPTTILGSQVVTITPGATVSVTIQVDAPALGSASSDTFVITAVSRNVPGLRITSQGVTAVDVQLAPAFSEAQTASGSPGSSVTYHFLLTNMGNVTDTFSLAVSGEWAATLLDGASTPPLAPGEGITVTLLVHIPADAPGGAAVAVTLTATSSWDSQVSAAVTALTGVYHRLYLPGIKR